MNSRRRKFLPNGRAAQTTFAGVVSGSDTEFIMNKYYIILLISLRHDLACGKGRGTADSPQIKEIKCAPPPWIHLNSLQQTQARGHPHRTIGAARSTRKA